MVKFIILSTVLFLCFCSDQKSPTAANIYPQAENQNFNVEKLAKAYNKARENGGILSLIVCRNNIIVADENFIKERADTNHNVRSVTKSILSALIGIAIDKGILPSVDAPIGEYLKKSVDEFEEEKGKITIKQLLTMSSGFPWQELDETASGYSTWINADNQAEYVLSLPFINPPGEIFTYNSGACHLLSIILTKAFRKSTLEFAEQHLFEPLGITRRRTWYKDKQDYYNGGSTLYLGPHEMLQFGLLYLNNGIYNGKQIVSEQWVKNSITTQIFTNNAVPYGEGYGYLWWTGKIKTFEYYFANGWGGQIIMNLPELKTTIVAQSDWTIANKPATQQWNETMTLIMNYIIPSIRDF